jgi:hypothetical protein
MYNFVLSHGHVIQVDGVDCVTLGHCINHPALQNGPYGTAEYLNELKADRGWADGLIERRTCNCIHPEATEEGEASQMLWLQHLLQHQAGKSLVVDKALLMKIHQSAMQPVGIESSFREGGIQILGSKYVPPQSDQLDRLVNSFCELTNCLLADKTADPYSCGAFCLW